MGERGGDKQSAPLTTRDRRSPPPTAATARTYTRFRERHRKQAPTLIPAIFPHCPAPRTPLGAISGDIRPHTSQSPRSPSDPSLDRSDESSAGARGRWCPLSHPALLAPPNQGSKMLGIRVLKPPQRAAVAGSLTQCSVWSMSGGCAQPSSVDSHGKFAACRHR